MGRHSAKVVPIRLGVVPQKQKEIPEYRSEDIQFDWFEAYVPPFPLTDAERELQNMNQAEKLAVVEWMKAKTRDMVNEELKNVQGPFA